MHTILQPLFILVFISFLFSADTAIRAGQSRDYIRAILYGVGALLALIYVVITLLAIS